MMTLVLLNMAVAGQTVQVPEAVNAESARAAGQAWHLTAAMSLGAPLFLENRASFGGSVAVYRDLFAGPVYLMGRLGWSQSTGLTAAWELQHHQVRADLGMGVGYTLGPGRLWAGGYVGARWLHEVRLHQQARRLAAAGRPTEAGHSDLLFGATGAEFGIAIAVLWDIGVSVAGGPEVVMVSPGGNDPQVHVGWNAHLGACYVF